MWSWKCELIDILHKGCLQLQIFWTKYCDMQRFNIQFTMPPALKEPCAKILIRVISRLMALWRASSCLGRALFQVSFPPQFERFPLFLFLNFSFTFLPILNSTTSSIASFAPNLHFANISSPRLYPNPRQILTKQRILFRKNESHWRNSECWIFEAQDEGQDLAPWSPNSKPFNFFRYFIPQLPPPHLLDPHPPSNRQHSFSSYCSSFFKPS